MDQLETNRVEHPQESAAQRKPYATPIMTDFGSVAELTRGAVGSGVDAGIYS